MRDAKDVLRLTASLIARARRAVGNAPYWEYISDMSPCELAVHGDKAVLTWVENGEYVLDRRETKFDAAILAMTDAEFEQWQKDEAVKYEREKLAQEAAEAAERIVEREARDRAEYARLREKFGP